MGLLDRVNGQLPQTPSRRTPKTHSRDGAEPLSLDDWAAYFSFGGLAYPLIQTTMGGVDKERIPVTAIMAQETNSAVFSLIQARVQAFAQTRFQWTRFNGAVPGDLFGTQELAVLENPWPGGHTSDLLARMEIDNCIAGNAFMVRPRPDRLARLRPDRVTIVLGSQMDAECPTDAPDIEVAGYFYMPRTGRGITFMPWEVAHYLTMPDPVFQFLGMSWLTPAIREVQGDTLMTEHKNKYLENSATVNLAIKFDPAVPIEHVRQFKALLEEDHKGAMNAYKCVLPSTLVYMWNNNPKHADEVSVGDEIVAWADGRAVPGTVTAVEVQPASPIVTVTTQRGRSLGTTMQHPYLARPVASRSSNGVAVRGAEEWVSAADLVPGDLVRVGLGWARDDVADELTPHEAWSLGLLVGDGCTATKNTPVISAWDTSVRARIEVGYELRATGKGHDYRMLGVRALCDRHGLIGKRAWEKRIPDAVMAGSAKIQAAFLSGLIDADGHVSDPSGRHSAEVGITSTSLGLMEDAQYLFAGLGLNASVSSPPSMCVKLPGEGLHRHQGHRLTIHGNDQAALLNEILDLACSAKSMRLALYATRPSLQRRSLYDRIKSVEIGPSEATIGIEVATHHTHVTNGIVTHNTLYLGGGADPVPVGSNMQQLDFAVVQGKGESRLAAAAGVPASWVGFSEGLQGSSLNAGNFNSARRRFTDATLMHMWSCAATALEDVLRPPDRGARLWFDTRIPVMREDAQDIAAIQLQEAQVINTLVMQGFDADSVVKAVSNNDWSALKHSGLTSVQLHPPGSGIPPAPQATVNSNGNGSSSGNGSPSGNGQASGTPGTPHGPMPEGGSL